MQININKSYGEGFNNEIDRQPKSNIDGQHLILLLSNNTNDVRNLDQNSPPYSFPDEISITCQIDKDTLINFNLMTNLDILNPIGHDLSNSSFRLYDGENILKEWQFQRGCCGVRGTCYSVLTNKRILTRHEECSCCCRPPYFDSSIYLSDIEQILKIQNRRSFFFFFLLFISGLFIIYFLFGWCSCRTYHLELRGAFGLHHIYLSRNDLRDAQLIISSIIDINKTRIKQDINQNNINTQF